jgi:hypothetical protein
MKIDSGNSRSPRLVSLVAPWAVAFFVGGRNTDQSPFSVERWGFPAGLAWFVWPFPFKDSAVPAAILIGWLVLLALTVWCIRQRREKSFVFHYVALCLLMVLSLSGWHRLLGAMADAIGASK